MTKPTTRKQLKQRLASGLSPYQDRMTRKELRYLALRRYKPKHPPDVYLIYLNLSLNDAGIGSDYLWCLSTDKGLTVIGDSVEECLDQYNDSLLLADRYPSL